MADGFEPEPCPHHSEELLFEEPVVVWILIHHDEYDEVRAVFATKEDAEAARTTRTPSGNQSWALGAHGPYCCDVQAWEVQ